jgi:hypothetical protein
MSEKERQKTPVPAARDEGEEDPALERILRDRKPGELESGMMSGSDEWDISATDRFEGDVSREEALKALKGTKD